MTVSYSYSTVTVTTTVWEDEWLDCATDTVDAVCTDPAVSTDAGSYPTDMPVTAAGTDPAVAATAAAPAPTDLSYGYRRRVRNYRHWYKIPYTGANSSDLASVEMDVPMEVG
jgi:hypothetical protein